MSSDRRNNNYNKNNQNHIPIVSERFFHASRTRSPPPSRFLQGGGEHEEDTDAYLELEHVVVHDGQVSQRRVRTRVEYHHHYHYYHHHHNDHHHHHRGRSSSSSMSKYVADDIRRCRFSELILGGVLALLFCQMSTMTKVPGIVIQEDFLPQLSSTLLNLSETRVQDNSMAGTTTMIETIQQEHQEFPLENNHISHGTQMNKDDTSEQLVQADSRGNQSIPSSPDDGWKRNIANIQTFHDTELFQATELLIESNRRKKTREAIALPVKEDKTNSHNYSTPSHTKEDETYSGDRTAEHVLHQSLYNNDTAVRGLHNNATAIPNLHNNNTAAPKLHSHDTETPKNTSSSRFPPRLSPWESKPPTPIEWISRNHKTTTIYPDYVVQRHECIQSIRQRQIAIFRNHLPKDSLRPNRGNEKSTGLDTVLVDPSYFANVGDHMLTVAELTLIETNLNQALPPKQCHYYQARNFYPQCDEVLREKGSSSKSRVAFWHAGGNWGDLWNGTQAVRIPSIQTILETGHQLISLPQSLFYSNETQKENEAVAIEEYVALGLNLAKKKKKTAANTTTEEEVSIVDTRALSTHEGRRKSKSRVILMWRERHSYNQATKLYPFATNVVVPDMAFQLGPYAPIRKNNDRGGMVDILLFLRHDKESILGSKRNEESIRAILPRGDLTFKIVDWDSRLKLFDTTDTFFTDSAIELLSLGKVVVCDRLHAAILSYVSGLPFVYIDQVSGKITKTLSTAFEHTSTCQDRRANRWDSAVDLEEALVKASEMLML